ncbi:MAG: vitamin K epoxide reductase family protein [Acidimicrobiales bacterium]
MRAWVRVANLVLAIAGLGVSTYLTIAHFNTKVTLACPATSIINCEKVTTSPESYFFHIPVAVLGLGFYLVAVALALPWPWRDAKFDLPRLAVASLGVLFVLYLIYTEIVTLGVICLWCTSVHIITLANFLVLIYDYVAQPTPTQRARTSSSISR